MEAKLDARLPGNMDMSPKMVKKLVSRERLERSTLALKGRTIRKKINDLCIIIVQLISRFFNELQIVWSI
ncbi:MAG: hypothetical protein NPIRA02_02550 [Nitrospirales bacterium]|nr:MAG: hypothetical protein NPIRA02_02550 [Nitrospirales bacterium]